MVQSWHSVGIDGMVWWQWIRNTAVNREGAAGGRGEVNGPRWELIYQKYYYNQIRRSHIFSH